MRTSQPQQYQFIDPITHGTGIQVHHRNIGVYDALQQLWREEIGSPEDDGMEITQYTPAFADGTRTVELSSSKWMAGSDPDTPFYQYNLRIQKDGKTPPQSLSVDIIPQKQGMMYKDGNKVKLPYGTGTRIKIQTAYPDGKEDVCRRANELLSTVLDEYESDALDRETGKITKMEKHIRFDRDKMPATTETLYNSERLIGWEGLAEIRGQHHRANAGWDIWRFGATEWSRLGFTTPSGDYRWSLKAYSSESWQDRGDDDWMHHPKLEAFYGGRIGSNESLLSISRWNEVEEFLSHVVAEHAKWAGVSASDLVEDPFFDAGAAKKREFDSLEGRKEDLKNLYQSMDSEIISAIEGSRSDVPAQLIRTLTDQPEGAFYSQLSEDLDVSKETVRYHAKQLEESGIVERVHIGQGGTRLRFKAAAVRDVANDVLSELTAGETAAEARQSDESRSERRRYQSLADLDVPPETVAEAANRGDLSDDEIRVPADWHPDD